MLGNVCHLKDIAVDGQAALIVQVSLRDGGAMDF